MTLLYVLIMVGFSIYAMRKWSSDKALKNIAYAGFGLAAVFLVLALLRMILAWLVSFLVLGAIGMVVYLLLFRKREAPR